MNTIITLLIALVTYFMWRLSQDDTIYTARYAAGLSLSAIALIVAVGVRHYWGIQ